MHFITFFVNTDTSRIYFVHPPKHGTCEPNSDRNTTINYFSSHKSLDIESQTITNGNSLKFITTRGRQYLELKYHMHFLTEKKRAILFSYRGTFNNYRDTI
ncbi:hypothetical protein C1645_787294 [Glomus cerebriforme]|uniref:Uncharacterized protein n=1 Tax=Glomus cerebriforme TaxID=658196 RepID=A0A397S9K4_9GLOM|nr:hypothetical protein C1645_787294 [Glomus cerebriforme]